MSQSYLEFEYEALGEAASESGAVVLVPPPGSLAQAFAEGFRLACKSRVETGRKGDHAMELEIGWIADPTFNAWADLIGETDVIGINIGVLEIVFKFWFALFSNPDFLPAFASAGHAVDQSVTTFGPGVSEFPQLADEWPATALSDPARLDLASKLANASMLWVFWHEFAHVHGGHVDYSYQRTGLKRLEEIGSERAGLSALTSQTLEWDADMAAVQDVMLQWLNPTVSYNSDGRMLWELSDASPFGQVVDAIALTSIAVAVVPLLFSEYDEWRHPEANERAHPPALIRMRFNLVQVAHVLRKRTKLPFDEGCQISLRHWGELITAIEVLLPGRPLRAELLDPGFNPKSDELIGSYIEEWARVQPDLEALKRGGILAPRSEDDAPY